MALLPKIKWNGDNHNIAQAPITVRYKKHGAPKYDMMEGLKKWNIWLEYRKNGNIFLTIRFHDNVGSTKIEIKQWTIFEMLLLRLRIRPIKPEKSVVLPRFGLGEMPDLSEVVTYDSIKPLYDEALWNLRNVINFAEGEQKELAEKQFDELVRKESIMSLLYSIDSAKTFKFEDKKTKKLEIKKFK